MADAPRSLANSGSTGTASPYSSASVNSASEATVNAARGRCSPPSFTAVKLAYAVVKMRAELGEQLRDARATRGWSLEAASRAAKISQGYLHKLEAGRVENPSPRVLQRLSQVLGVPYGRLMELADYLMPTDAVSAESGQRSPKEVDMTAKTTNEPATNRELARLLEAVLRELAEVRRGQDELSRALKRIASGED